MFADYSTEIKIVIFPPVSECQRDVWKSYSNWLRITRFNSVNSEIIGRNFTKFVHDVAGLLSFKFLKVDSRSANPLSNAEAKSKGRFWRCLRTAPKFNWQHPFIRCRDFIAAINVCIYKAILHSVSIAVFKRQSREKAVNFDACKKPSKLIGYNSNVYWATAKLMSM